MTKKDPKKKNKIYRRKTILWRFADWCNLRTIYRFREKVNAIVYVKTGGVISAIVNDILIKNADSRYQSLRLPYELDDEIPEDYLIPDEKHSPKLNILFYNGTGKIKVLKLEDEVNGKAKLKAYDVRVNDMYEQTLQKIFKMYEVDKERKWFYTFVIAGIIAMGLFTAFAMQGIIQFYEAIPAAINAGIARIESIVPKEIPATTTAPLLLLIPSKKLFRGIKKWIRRLRKK